MLAIFTFGFVNLSQVSAASQAECTFNRDLTVGSVNDPATNDLVNLQKFLTRTGFLTSPAGDIFGSTLRTALASYQVARGVSPSNGYFGPITRPMATVECLGALTPLTGAKYRLVTSTSGNGFGNVTGAGLYNEGSNVVLEATPIGNSKFSGWNNGRASGKSTRYSFVITEDQVANAVFDLSVPVTPTTATTTVVATGTMYTFTTYLNNAPGEQGESSGSISGTQSAVKTYGSNSVVTGTYPAGTRITLTATPAQGSMFLTWFGSGPCSGGNPTCTFILNGNMGTEAVFKAVNVSANSTLGFNKIVVFKDLNLNYSMGIPTVNSSVGSVTGTPSGQLPIGSLVTMTAVPAPGYIFSGWSNNGIDGYYSGGKCNNQGSTCSFALDVDTIIYARFSPATNSGTATPPVTPPVTPPTTPPVTPPITPVTTGTYDLVVTKSGAAASYGVVTPLGKTSYPAGSSATVTVSVTDSTKAKFAGWNDSDVCSGRALTCTLPMTKNQTANANFDLVSPSTSMFSSPSAIYSAIKSALNLQKGSVQSGVAALQKYLNTKGYVVNETPGEAGSPGNESNYFGEKTKQAVIKFQQDNGIPATGVVGAQTKEVIKVK